MKKTGIKSDYIFSISWEVCNKVGGIYTVLSTQAKTLMERTEATLVYIGPLFEGKKYTDFIEDEKIFAQWREEAKHDGLNVKIGRWNVPGKPIAILVDFTPFYSIKNEVYADAWRLFGVDSLHAYGDYDEASLFSYAAAMVVKSLYTRHLDRSGTIYYHAHEWMTGLGALFIKHYIPSVATIFTTHATSIGRSICGNNKMLYDYFEGYNGDQMSRELNMESKHSVEKQTAHRVDCFTTVSELTAKECRQLLEKEPDVVTVNGFESDFLPSSEASFEKKRAAARKRILTVANRLTGKAYSEETIIVGIGGRYEFRNKGIDMFLDSMKELLNRDADHSQQILALINVPGWVESAREDLQMALKSRKRSTVPLDYPYITHKLYNMDSDRMVETIVRCGFDNENSRGVSVVLVPCYLDGNDGIFNMSYYDLLIGHDLALYPSYYEPWGYTPLESTAFRVPTITTDLAGFGLWVNTICGIYSTLESGVEVVHRTDSNYHQAVNQIVDAIIRWKQMAPEQRECVRKSAFDIAKQALWSNFINYYLKAYSVAKSKIESETIS